MYLLSQKISIDFFKIIRKEKSNEEPSRTALLGICHRTIHTVQRRQNKAFLLRKPLPADPESFAERFRARRVAHGHTQTEMACKFEISLSTVKFWEQGKTQPTQSVRAQVEAFLNGVRLAKSGST